MSQNYNMAGDSVQADSFQFLYDAMSAVPLTAAVGVYAGTGAPTFSAAKGSVYTNITGSSSSTRLYVNTTGSTTWTNVTTAA